ncbi:chaplin [Streptomyces celluloflavus]|uniref:chaplin n=1 Tax=Streptomyces celluloflavus TaxID=58344 RepID=UPI00365C2B19
MRQVARKGLITMAAAGGVIAVTGGYAFADAGAHGLSAHSPGVVAGNTIQLPVDVPVNACGNTIDVIGLLNPAFGNHCAHTSHGGRHGAHDGGGRNRETSGRHHGAEAHGSAVHSPGVGSGNTAQVPIDVPVNACGNTVDVVGLLNPAFGNECGHVSPTSPEYPRHPEHPQHPDKPTPRTPSHPRTPEHPRTPSHPRTPERPGHPRSPEHPQSPRTPGNRVTPDTPAKRTPTVNAPHSQIVTTPAPVKQLAHTGAGTIGYAVPASAGLLLGGALLYRRARTARR